mgnify:FL=1
MNYISKLQKDDLNPYKGVRAENKQGGAWIVDGRHVADTVRCIHCSGQFVRMERSRSYSYCMKCKGFVCDNPACQGLCVPLEMRLQEMEIKRSRNETLKVIDSFPTTIILGGKIE